MTHVWFLLNAHHFQTSYIDLIMFEANCFSLAKIPAGCCHSCFFFLWCNML